MRTLRFPISEEEVPLSEIDLSDDRFRLSYGRPGEGLFRSLSIIGLQRPILLQAIGGGRFRLVSGRRRLLALKRLGYLTVRAGIVSETTPEADLFLFQFFDNLDRGFNVVEQALAVKGLCRFF